ncbi:MAG: protein kinase [Micrococcales bacterium]|nr:protein kinase [Micrococcales bacterium]
MPPGVVLSQWLQHRAGTVVAGSLVSLSPSGLPRVSSTVDSHRLRVMLPVSHGGQAAVCMAVPDGYDQPRLALRVQAVASGRDKTRQLDRLVATLTVAEAARADPATYPAVLPVLESFTLSLPSTELTTTGGTTGPSGPTELWCDVMAWCPTSLASTGPADRDPRTVATQIFPLLTTMQAVHDNLGIVHRDITPHNVLVDPAGRLLLTDWGIAHTVAADRTSTHTQIVGNRGFSLPPEMLAGETTVGRYTDAWYLGSLLVWMLTGGTPGPDGRLPPDLPGGPLGQRLAAIAQGLCWPDPRQRMPLPEAVRRLTQPQPTDTVWAPPPAAVTAPHALGALGPDPDPPAAPHRRRVLATVLTCIVTLAIGVTIGVLWPTANDDAGTPTTSQPPDPAPDPTYPPFSGLATAFTAFPLVEGDPPDCSQVDPADYVPAGAQEVFRCVWSDIDAAVVFLSRWKTSPQGADAWRNLDQKITETAWSLSDNPQKARGPDFSWTTDVQHYAQCYVDLPYCIEMHFVENSDYAKLYNRIVFLNSEQADNMVTRWPESIDTFSTVTIPEPS